MKCYKCKKDFPENEIQESHDVSCYLFYNIIGRRLKKQEADKWGRHYVCKKCHEEYEITLNNFLILRAKEFAGKYFK